ncbi:MAG: hypothetical protein AB199_00460 [Parcubacteria bacterium C7867-004]|nr:MAG: hypothetical protein AB199_00460 [Parcubacteria bacterium C7867-004]
MISGFINAVVGGGEWLFGIVLYPLGVAMLGLANLILWLVGLVFNWAVIRTVYQFGTYFGTSDAMLVAWGVMRDIANIGLLFGFIFMGVMLILNVDGGGHGHGGGISAKKAIPRLILFAVLVNFSLFATQAIIDVSNGLASVFAEQAGQKCDPSAPADPCVNVGISGLVSDRAGIGSIWTGGDGVNATKPLASAIVLICLAIFVMITAMVLLAGAIMFIYRVVVLSLLMVTSPIGFAGMAIPSLKKLADEWWSKLFSQAFFAPAYLLLIFISLKLTETLAQGSSGKLGEAIAGTGGVAGAQAAAGNVQVVLVFAVIIGFMMASLIVANKMGAMGAKFAMNTASAVTFGSAARVANYGVGGGAFALRRLQQKTGFGGRAGQVAVNRILRPLEKANLDIRRAGVGSVLGAAGITAGAKPAEHATFGDAKHLYEDIKEGKAGKELEREYLGEVKKQTLEKEAHDQEEGHGVIGDDSKQYLASLSTKQLEELHGIKEGIASMAQNLTPEQFESLMKSDKLDEGQKGQLRKGRFDAIQEQLTTINDPAATPDQKKAAQTALKRWSAKDLSELAKSNDHAGLLSDENFAANISDDQFDAVIKNDKLTGAQQGALRDARDKRFEGTRAAGTIGGMSNEDIGKLKPAILARAEVHQNMSGRQLATIDPNKLNPGELRTVLGYLRSLPATSPKRVEFDALLAANPKVKERWAGITI